MAYSGCTLRLCLTLAVAGLGFGAALHPLAAQIGVDSDAAIEQCLRAGTVGKKTKRLKGVTRPVRVVLDCEGELHLAANKTLDAYRRGLTRFGDGSFEIDFADSFRFERAAYLLDRELGLNMVPAAVIRSVRRKPGALVDWISHASHEYDLEPKLTTTELLVLADQKALMHLFDALIFNTDRNPSNWLIDHDRHRLYLIDHSRSFRLSDRVPEAYLGKRVRLPREVFENLVALNRARLDALLADLLEPGQIEAVMSRRDRLLEIIESACREFGEEVVIKD